MAEPRNRQQSGRRDPTSDPRRAGSRVPPHNLDAEESLLGGMMLSRDVVNQIAEMGVSADHFYKPTHQHVFSAMRGLMANGQPVDVVTVSDELRRNGLLEECGGAAALLELQNNTPSVANSGRYEIGRAHV